MMNTRLVPALLLVAILSPAITPADAQVIRVKLLPIAESEQFSFMPSAGMASVSIALADTLLDPFSNPAKGTRLGSARYFGAPSFFSVSSNTGSGTTLPGGALFKVGSTFAGIGAAYQQIHDPRPFDFTTSGFACIDFCPIESQQPAPSSYRNNYSFAILGHTLPSRLSFAASAMWSGLGAVDGVDQFYAGNNWLKQKGEAVDLRFGALKEWENGQSFEAVLVRNRFGNAHDVGFNDRFWDPVNRRFFTQPRVEHNAERSHTWGLHVEYERPLSDTTWRVGALATGNRIQHLSIPRYDVMFGLGDAGRSSAMNLGVGVGRMVGPVAFGLDAIYEPIRTTTWGDSIDNSFTFSNAKLRGGVSRSFKLADPRSSITMQIGAELYSIHYTRNELDRANQISRVRSQTWLERTRSAGMSFRVPGIEVNYQVRTRSGVGRPGVNNATSSNLAAPQSDIGIWMPPLTNAAALGAVRVTWHQFAISLPQR